MKNVVIVDDYLDFAESLADFVEKKDEISCKAIGNPIDAYYYISEEGNVDLVITDYEMPVMNGFDFAYMLLADNPDLRIIIISGHGKKYLEKVAEEREMSGKIEVADKDDMKLFKNLFN